MPSICVGNNVSAIANHADGRMSDGGNDHHTYASHMRHDGASVEIYGTDEEIDIHKFTWNTWMCSVAIKMTTRHKNRTWPYYNIMHSGMRISDMHSCGCLPKNRSVGRFCEIKLFKINWMVPWVRQPCNILISNMAIIGCYYIYTNGGHVFDFIHIYIWYNVLCICSSYGVTTKCLIYIIVFAYVSVFFELNMYMFYVLCGTVFVIHLHSYFDEWWSHTQSKYGLLFNYNNNMYGFICVRFKYILHVHISVCSLLCGVEPPKTMPRLWISYIKCTHYLCLHVISFVPNNAPLCYT